MPIRSTAMHRPWELRCGITLRQRCVDVGFPCRNRGSDRPPLLRCNAFDSRRSRCISIRTGSPLGSNGSRCSWIPESCVPLSHLARIKLAHRIEDRRGPMMCFFRNLCLEPLRCGRGTCGVRACAAVARRQSRSSVPQFKVAGWVAMDSSLFSSKDYTTTRPVPTSGFVSPGPLRLLGPVLAAARTALWLLRRSRHHPAPPERCACAAV